MIFFTRNRSFRAFGACEDLQRVSSLTRTALPETSYKGEEVLRFLTGRRTTMCGVAVRITAPAVASDAVTAAVGDTRLTVGLNGGHTVRGAKAGSGTVVYPDAAPSTDLAVQPTKDAGVRVLVTLKDSAAATEQRFPLGPSAGERYKC
ncbi:hypothetical protein [Streptomyces sp. bgisy022]|uniref:hypothetical protein n=1 Tax=Streptomyces sp. bgisy022 TaxID=3413769 RepID=UPI003D741E60